MGARGLSGARCHSNGKGMEPARRRTNQQYPYMVNMYVHSLLPSIDGDIRRGVGYGQGPRTRRNGTACLFDTMDLQLTRSRRHVCLFDSAGPQCKEDTAETRHKSNGI